jgi:hypothetical protein
MGFFVELRRQGEVGHCGRLHLGLVERGSSRFVLPLDARAVVSTHPSLTNSGSGFYKNFWPPRHGVRGIRRGENGRRGEWEQREMNFEINSQKESKSRGGKKFEIGPQNMVRPRRCGGWMLFVHCKMSSASESGVSYYPVSKRLLI